MLGKINKNNLIRYKVCVLKTRSKPPCLPSEFAKLCDELRSCEHEGDVYYGFGYPKYYTGKHFDLWLVPNKNDDMYNFIGFGRINLIKSYSMESVYCTQNGRYLVEVV